MPAFIATAASQQLLMASMVTPPTNLCCLLQHETTEEYKAAMGMGGLNHGDEDAAAGSAFQFDPAMERRKKYAAEKVFRGAAAGRAAGHGASYAAAAAAADEAKRRAAADEVAKQLLGVPLCLPSFANLFITLPAFTRRHSCCLTACGPALCAHVSGLFHLLTGITSQGLTPVTKL